MRGGFTRQPVEEREIAIDGHFREPITSVRPPTVTQHKREMRMQGQREVSLGTAFHDAHQGRRLLGEALNGAPNAR